MNTQTHSNLNNEKVAVYATAVGVLLIIIGALLLFTPKVIEGSLQASISYDWLAVIILTMGGLLNVISVRLNTTQPDLD